MNAKRKPPETRAYAGLAEATAVAHQPGHAGLSGEAIGWGPPAPPRNAAAAALVARAIGTEYARRVTCQPDRSHDGSTIWLLNPASLGVLTPRGPARAGVPEESPAKIRS